MFFVNGVTVALNKLTIANGYCDSGGSIYNAGTLTVTNSTLSGNSATNGGGIYNAEGTLNYANTIIANSTTGGDCFNGATIGTNTNNLVKDGSCSPAIIGDPLLSAPGNYGGLTQTFALLPGSPAIAQVLRPRSVS